MEIIERIILFGASERGIRYMNMIGTKTVLYFCDNDEKKIGTVLENKEVIGVEKLKEIMSPEIKIVISSTFEKEIFEQLKQLGFEKHVDINFLEYLFKAKSYILFQEPVSEKGYFSGIYDDVGSDFHLLKREYIYGKVCEAGKTLNLNIPEKCLVPICSLYANKAHLNITSNSYIYEKDLLFNKFEYFPIENKDELEIKASQDIVVGDPIPLNQKKQHKTKLNLLILIDSLTQNLIDECGLEKLMPYTFKFFKDAIKFSKCYCCADWTLPGAATVFTGKYPIEHRMLKSLETNSLGNNMLVTSNFKRGEYLTSIFNSNWRVIPEYGYIKDMDRSVYVNGDNKGTASELICNFLEHLRAFPNRDHFSVLSLFDLHHLQRKIPDIACQTHTSLATHFYEDSFEGKSVFRNYDRMKKDLYFQEIKHLDFNLRILYSYLDEKYTDNLSVVFGADHGVSFISGKENEEFKGVGSNFNESMFHVPLIVKAPGLTDEVVTELVDNRSISSVFQYLLNEENLFINKDIKTICKQDYVYNESIYQGQTYKVKIIDKKYIFYLISEKEVDEDCRITLGNFEVKLIDNKTKRIVKRFDNESLYNKYIDIVKSHVELALPK